MKALPFRPNPAFWAHKPGPPPPDGLNRHMHPNLMGSSGFQPQADMGIPRIFGDYSKIGNGFL